jgi:predicted Mrr-cat superfamily restriction endonuclease
MTVWILHQPLTAEEEARIQERPYLALPFDGVPDLSAIHSREQCRKLFKSLYPEAPPETLAGMTDRLWQRYSELRATDTIAVPLPLRKEVALAEVTGRYRYEPQAGQQSAHQVLVKWYRCHLRFSSLCKHQDLLANNGEQLVEVMDSDLRTKLREKLPHTYNRFARWKWLLAVFFMINVISLLLSLVHSIP